MKIETKMLGFEKIIRAIESEIKAEYVPSAIKWSDENHNGAWSSAIDRFDKSLSIAIEREDYQLARIEGDFYKGTILNLLASYKKSKKMEAGNAFFEALRST